MRLPRLLPLLVLALSASLALTAPAQADNAYNRVGDAFARAGGHLNPCSFTEAELKAAVREIPPNLRHTVPALTAAMLEGIAAHERGDCKGVKPDEGTTGGAAPGNVPSTAVPPVTTPTTTQTAPTQTQTAPAPPAATTPTTTAPAPATTPPAVATTSHERDRTPLVIALIALGALVLLALAGWGWARMRGWDPVWASRTRHAWGEAGYRTTSTWSEFTDWLRLGR